MEVIMRCLCLVPLLFGTAFCGLDFSGGRVYSDVTLKYEDSPFLIQDDIIVEKEATLIVEPGVEMMFAPQRMLAVNGTLIAKGTKERRILMTKSSGARDAPVWPSDVRLVDERSVHLGRLQLLHQGKWRGVCANYVNWTAEDVNVACRQLGFERGESHREYFEGFSFLAFARNDSKYMLFYQPHCVGTEDHLSQCAGFTNVKIGSRVCHNQLTVHLYCEGLAPTSPAHDNWWGLEFYNSTTYTLRDGSTQSNESTSMLHYVDIEFSGVDRILNAVPAIRASPTAPHLINVQLQHNALDGTNYTDIRAFTIVESSRITNNRGHGLGVETHIGRVSITNSELSGNAGNGVKGKFLDGRFPIFNDRYTFCELPSSTSAQRFPQLITGIPSEFTSLPCEVKLRAIAGFIITLNVLEMEIENDPYVTGTLEVFDGDHHTDRKIAEYEITNGTLPQGITSTENTMLVRFSWTSTFNCPILEQCVKFTLLFDAGASSMPEFYMNNSHIDSNLQHGLFLENVRNYAFVNASEMSHNMYGAGFKVYGGAGDVHVNASRVDYNHDSGINITYGGGLRIINRTSISHNLGNGLNVTLNETSIDNKTRYARHQITEVFFSEINYNEGHGVRVGNFCEKGLIAINDTKFHYNHGNAVDLTSCFKVIPANNVTNMTVAYNNFEGNYGHAIVIAPLLNAVGRIANNTFTKHERHTLLIDNTDDIGKAREYSQLKVDYEIEANNFLDNRGFYVVNARLTEGSNVQHMYIRYNHFKQNVIEGSFQKLNERSRAHAVVIVSSSNVNFSRNWMEDPGSRFEIATQLVDKSVTLDVSRQWWHEARDPDNPESGIVDYYVILPYLFDQFSRYNLAELSYHPCLKFPDLWLSPDNEEDQRHISEEFDRGATIGGRLNEAFTALRDTTYMVDKDITVLPEGSFHVQPGARLEFENGLGILIQGYMDTTINSGEHEAQFVLKNDSTYQNSSTVRLVDGPTEWEGRVEVRPTANHTWGTICNEGWTDLDASVVCKMLGLVIHPQDWRIYTEMPGPSEQPVWRSSVQCIDLDMDIMQCRADDHMDHSCNHTQDVYVRCYKPTWAGIHFTATARPGRLAHSVIEGAGLLDPSSFEYSPALLLDYNVQTISHLHVKDNLQTGVLILHNDVYANAKIAHSTITNNFGNGISTRTSFFEVEFCTVTHNTKAGVDYNPHKTVAEGVQIRAGIVDPLVFSQLSQDQAGSGSELIQNEGYEFLVTMPAVMADVTTYNVEFQVNSNHHLVVDIIDYNPDTMQENLTIFDGRRSSATENTHRWQIEDDLVDFPIESAGRYLLFEWTVRDVSSGRLTFAIRSKPDSWRWPFARLTVRNSTLQQNEHGIVARHYNQPSNEYYDIFTRYRWEYITFYGVLLKENQAEAIHVPSLTKYHELYLPTYEELQHPGKIAEIRYEIEACRITENGGVMVAEHNHVEFANNVWIWHITNNKIDKNKDGGFFLELPKVNLMYTELYNHSVEVNDTHFEDNENFEFRIEGFYCNATIARNRFINNRCKMGCITISGTEKDFDFYDNEVTDNRGKYIMEIYMTRHTPYTRWVEATFEYNNFKRNAKLDDEEPPLASTPSSYTLAIKGLQNITINRNLFDNFLDYELVGGQDSSSLEIYLDVTQNYWGTTDQQLIQELIFDFEDWNNYAIAEYYPFLMGDYFDAPLSTGGKWKPELDLDEPIGGRIDGHLTLTTRNKPYIIKADLTVMPTGSLLIEEGTTLEFYPNVGILVLGAMYVNGKSYNRVEFRPVEPENIVQRYGASQRDRKKRQLPSSVRGDLHAAAGTNAYDDPQIRLNGEGPDEGFIEFYNETEKRWTITCDESFNERTAEVACKTMGKQWSNVIVRRTSYYDIFILGYPKMHDQVVEWFWRRTYICDGSEDDITQCQYQVNYQLEKCMDEKQYVYVKCGPRNLANKYEYWGNIRFSSPEYEQGDIENIENSMEFVDIYGAGILHGEKAAAIQGIHRAPNTDYIRISHCNWNGYDFIAPRDEFLVENNRIDNINGYGIGGLILNGESNEEGDLSSFVPLRESEIPYNTYGFVRMCTTEKLILVKDRVLLYYKYRFDTIDCIKILRSKEQGKQIAVRFLQMKLFNDSFYKNAVEMYNGEYFDPDMLLGEITTDSTTNDIRRSYMTTELSDGYKYDTMGIRITASAAYGEYGFIAEVVTIPLSPGWKPILGPGLRQRIIDTSMTGNQHGAVKFSNVGEINPTVIIERSRIQDCGYGIYNLSSPPVMDLQVQNSRLLTIANCYVVGNHGGIHINTTTTSITTAIWSNITNNVMVFNTHGEMLHVEGHHYQGFWVRNNFIAHNSIGHRNVVSMQGVSANFSLTTLVNNTAMTMINSSLPEQVSITQRFYDNGIYDNFAIGGNHTTVFCKSAKATFNNNFFLNTYNLYDMVTYNRTHYDSGQYPTLDATWNWWGQGKQSYVDGRIWHQDDDTNLIKVLYAPFHEQNTSLTQGRCYPGWRLYDKRCYMYMGGVAPYDEAYDMCQRDHGTLARALDRDLEKFLGDLVSSQQANYDKYWRTWVWHEVSKDNLCSVLRDYKVEHIDCDVLLPYICEQSPYVSPEVKWRPIIIAISVTVAGLLILLIIAIFAIVKSRQRSKQRLDRRNSLRASLRGSKASMISARSTSRLPQDMQIQSRRRPPLAKPLEDSFFNLSGATLGDTSDYSDDKARLDFRRPSTPASLDYSSSVHKPEASSYYDSDLGPVHRGSFDNLADPRLAYDRYNAPRLENEIASVPARPLMFDRAYKNKGFDDDRSLDRSHIDMTDQSARYHRPTPQKARPPLTSQGAGSRAPLYSDRSMYDPNTSVSKSQDFDKSTPTKPRPPLHPHSRAPIHSDRSDPDQSFNRSVPDLLNTSRSSGGRNKPRPPINTGRPRPPQSSLGTDVVRSVNPNPAYPRERHYSRETLGSSSSARSIDDRPRPRETDM